MVKDVVLPPYNPYDPEQNQLLLIKPSWRNPIMTKDRVVNFLDALEPMLEVAQNEIRIRTSMNVAEYVTSYNWHCRNPIELSEPTFKHEARQDFGYQVSNTYQPEANYNHTAAPARSLKT